MRVCARIAQRDGAFSFRVPFFCRTPVFIYRLCLCSSIRKFRGINHEVITHQFPAPKARKTTILCTASDGQFLRVLITQLGKISFSLWTTRINTYERAAVSNFSSFGVYWIFPSRSSTGHRHNLFYSGTQWLGSNEPDRDGSDFEFA